MPDISMCANKTCPDRALCYRFTAEPNPYRQAYMDFNLPAGARRCDWFSPNDSAPTPLKKEVPK